MPFEKILKELENAKESFAVDDYEQIIRLINKSKNKKEDDKPELSSKAKAEEFKNEGNQYFKAKKYDEAVLAYSQAIEEDESNPVYFSNRAAAYAKLGMKDNGIEDCNSALQLDQNFVKAYLRLGDFHKEEDLEKAIEFYKKALEIEPDNELIKKKISHCDESHIQNDKKNDVDVQEMFKDPKIMEMAKSMMKDKSPEELNEMIENMMKNFKK
ncbi:hypothetical protein GVAV_001898 [Gurleya vavrai]